MLPFAWFFVGCGEPKETVVAFQDDVSYANDIVPIVNEFCATCHAGIDPEGNFTLTSYMEVREETEIGALLERINDPEDPMPQDGLMPAPYRRLFRLWAEGGYVEHGTRSSPKRTMDYGDFTPPEIRPVDIENEAGFELLESMAGHWVGSMNLMGTKYEWWAFDYRPIAPSHVHGIFEGGTIGNLFTSFFVTEFGGVKTIMARNGGLLNGIYRTSYFVLDQVKRGFQGTTYRLVDAYGGRDIMDMELTLADDNLTWNAWTSRLGLKKPTRHMAFQAQRRRPEIAQTETNRPFKVSSVRN